MDEFYRIKRLPPYVFEEVNRPKALARHPGPDIRDPGRGQPDPPAPARPRGGIGLNGAGPGVGWGVGDTPMINVMMGKCVGGSSTLTGGVCFRTPGHVLADWRRDRGLPHGADGPVAARLPLVDAGSLSFR